jgi:hypothetical protein
VDKAVRHHAVRRGKEAMTTPWRSVQDAEKTNETVAWQALPCRLSGSRVQTQKTDPGACHPTVIAGRVHVFFLTDGLYVSLGLRIIEEPIHRSRRLRHLSFGYTQECLRGASGFDKAIARIRGTDRLWRGLFGCDGRSTSSLNRMSVIDCRVEVSVEQAISAPQSS